MLDWQEYFKPPFFADTFNPGMIWDADFEMVLCFRLNSPFLA